MFQLENVKNKSRAAIVLNAVFFIFSVVFIHPIVSYSDWCLIHTYNDTQEISSHSGEISEQLRVQPSNDENVAHVEETEAHCVEASSAFIQTSNLKSPEPRIAIAYILRENAISDLKLVADSFVNEAISAPSHYLSILRSIVLIV